MTIKILPNESKNPPGKLADVELRFQQGDLAGLKLTGFAIWERRGNNGWAVTFPARRYTVNAERRSYALLRPIADPAAQTQLGERILDAFTTYEREQASHE